MINVLDGNNNPIAQGSGFCIGKGLFLTNAHVVDSGTKYQLVADDGSIYDVAGVVKYDKALDLAIIKTSQLIDMQPLTLGSKDMVVQGDQIVTIGSPYGLENTVSDGIVSAFRSIDNTEIIQITAPITHGNSGSPLFDMKGYVIGINSSIIEATGDLNFAIAIDYTLNWVKELKDIPFNDIKVISRIIKIDLAFDINSMFNKKKLSLMASFYFWWEGMDSNHRNRLITDLQSAPFGRSGTLPYLN